MLHNRFFRSILVAWLLLTATPTWAEAVLVAVAANFTKPEIFKVVVATLIKFKRPFGPGFLPPWYYLVLFQFVQDLGERR
ncbi:MAG: hypothetical protein ACXWLH_06745, partial [Candidatus Saccharimonadales bacterium]